VEGRAGADLSRLFAGITSELQKVRQLRRTHSFSKGNHEIHTAALAAAEACFKPLGFPPVVEKHQHTLWY
jgi:hypothetical protein